MAPNDGSFGSNFANFLTGMTGEIYKRQAEEQAIKQKDEDSALQLNLNLFSNMLQHPGQFNEQQIRQHADMVAKNPRIGRIVGKDYQNQITPLIQASQEALRVAEMSGVGEWSGQNIKGMSTDDLAKLTASMRASKDAAAMKKLELDRDVEMYKAKEWLTKIDQNFHTSLTAKTAEDRRKDAEAAALLKQTNTEKNIDRKGLIDIKRSEIGAIGRNEALALRRDTIEPYADKNERIKEGQIQARIDEEYGKARGDKPGEEFKGWRRDFFDDMRRNDPEFKKKYNSEARINLYTLENLSDWVRAKIENKHRYSSSSPTTTTSSTTTTGGPPASTGTDLLRIRP